ncbi:prepilin-type N-terminal cleavage/methylation domain-containing protein [Chromobacterium haemolyticum]|nr:prepilin-type N-terminal cleavage/methylation domain-containing protein [Chromobacterium haemolyticum]
MVTPPRRQRGLTLMELCATLALIGLLALLSVPLALRKAGATPTSWRWRAASWRGPTPKPRLRL